LTGELEESMNQLLEYLEIPLKVIILSERKDKDAETNLEEGIIFIYSQDEEEAWRSLLHEIFELRLKTLIDPYRRLVNKLIEYVEKEIYKNKERVVNAMLKDFEAWNAHRKNRCNSSNVDM